MDDNDEYSESNIPPQASKKCKNDAIKNSKRLMDDVTDDSISSEEDSVLNKRVYERPILPNYNETEKNIYIYNLYSVSQKQI